MTLKVRDLMTEDVVTVARNDALERVDELMKSRSIRHLVVLDEYDRVAGVVSHRDMSFNALLRALGFGGHAVESALESQRVKAVMSETVETASPNDSLESAARRMVDERIGCLPVVDGETLVGILTETDVLAAVAEGLLKPV